MKKIKNKKQIILKSFGALTYAFGILCICIGIIGINSSQSSSFESVKAHNSNLNKTVSTKELMLSYKNLSQEAKKKEKEKQIMNTATAVYPKSECQAYAYRLVLNTYGWSKSDFSALVSLWNRESGWNASSHSASGAHGIPQALPASKMASEGSDYYTNCKTQIRWGLKYVKGKYGSPSRAWSYFQSHGWY